MTPDQRIAAIREREAEAAPGMWEMVKIAEDEHNGCITHEHFDIFRQEAVMRDVDSREGSYTARAEFTMVNVGCFLAEEADAAFAAHARSDIPWLLKQLASERSARERAERALTSRLATIQSWRLSQGLTPGQDAALAALAGHDSDLREAYSLELARASEGSPSSPAATPKGACAWCVKGYTYTDETKEWHAIRCGECNGPHAVACCAPSQARQ